MIQNLFLISAAVTPVILLLLFPLLLRRYGAVWRYWVWLVIALRLLIPVRFEWRHAPIVLPAVPDVTVYERAEPQPSEESISREEPPAVPHPRTSDRTEALTDKMLTGRSLRSILETFYLLGAFGFGIYPFLAYWLFLWKIRSGLTQVDADAPILVYRSQKISSPMLIGYFRQKILIPDAAYTPEEQALILRHELAHRSRGDLWYKLLLLFCRAVHWFNPAVWLMVRRAEADMEYCCDNAVLKNCNLEEKKIYSQTILKTMEE